MLTLALFVVTLSASACDLKTILKEEESTPRRDIEEPKEKPKPKAKQAEPKPSAKPASSIAVPAAPEPVRHDFFADATPVGTLFKEKIGASVRLRDLMIYPDRAIALIQDPAEPTHFDRYTLRNGTVGKPTPVAATFVDDEKGTPTIDLDAIDFTIIPAMVKTALSELSYEDGSVTHVALRDMHRKDKEWRVFVRSTRRSGMVDYDLQGKLLKVHR
jgi:hypothetical protein